MTALIIVMRGSAATYSAFSLTGTVTFDNSSLAFLMSASAVNCFKASESRLKRDKSYLIGEQ